MRSLLFLYLAAEVASFTCSPNWVEYYDYCYHKLYVEATYRNALDLCGDTGSDLLTIDNEAEQDFVTRYLADREFNLWLDAANSKYENWMNHSAERHGCAVIVKIKRDVSKWIDEECSELNEVVCKKRIHVIPTTTTLKPTTSKIPTTTLIPTTSKPKTCTENWKQFHNNCYRVTDNKTTFAEGEQICKNWGGHLASVHSEAENVFLTTLYDSKKHDQEPYYWFRIGGYSFDGLNFLWTDGTAFDYSFWDAGFPRKGVYLNIVAACSKASDSYAKKWENISDDKRFNVCLIKM